MDSRVVGGMIVPTIEEVCGAWVEAYPGSSLEPQYIRSMLPGLVEWVVTRGPSASAASKRAMDITLRWQHFHDR